MGTPGRESRAALAPRAQALFEERFGPLTPWLAEHLRPDFLGGPLDGLGLTTVLLSHCVPVPEGRRFSRHTLARGRAIALDVLEPFLAVEVFAAGRQLEVTDPRDSRRRVRGAVEQWYQAEARWLQRVVDIWIDVALPGLELEHRGEPISADFVRAAQGEMQRRLAADVPDERRRRLGSLYAHHRQHLADRLWLTDTAAPATRALGLTDLRDDVIDEEALLNEAVSRGMGSYLVAGADGRPRLYQLGLTDLARKLADWHRRQNADGTQTWGAGLDRLPEQYDAPAPDPGAPAAAERTESHDDLRTLLGEIAHRHLGDPAWEAALTYVVRNPPGTRVESYESIAAKFHTTVSRVRTRVTKIRAEIARRLRRHG